MIEIIALFGFVIGLILTISSYHIDYGFFLIRTKQFYIGFLLGLISLGLLNLVAAVSWAVFWFILHIMYFGGTKK